MSTTGTETYEQRQEREVKEARERQATLKALVAQIPAHLPGWTFESRPNKWDPEERSNTLCLVQSGGAGLIEVKCGGYRQEERIVISPEWNGLYDHRRWDDAIKDITVAHTKTAPQIAKEITRRVLPDYLPKLAAAAERKAASDDRDARTLANAEAFAKATGAQIKQDNNGKLIQHGNLRLDILTWWSDGFHIDAENTVAFPKFATDAATAAEIIRLLLEAKKRQAQEPDESIFAWPSYEDFHELT